MAFMRTAFSELYYIARARTLTHHLLRSRLTAAFVFSVCVDVAGTVAIYLAERHAPGTKITTIGDALFFTTTQLLTVSSQLPNPLTVPGRVIDVLLELYGITVVAAIAGSFGAFFHRRGTEMAAAEGGG